jgi:hypothetical protein
MGGVNINLLPAEGLVLIDAKTTNNTTGIGVMPESVCGRYVEATFYVTFDATAAAGVVVIESAASRDYSGTWVNEGTVTFASASKAHRVSLNMLTGAMRARITTTVTSGTCTVTAFASTNS